MLFITNGDSAAGRTERAGFTAEIVPWRDVLHEGPVPAGLSLEELGEVRARFIADQGWADFGEATEDFARRDATLGSFGEHEEVVLWFEHDLYDQLQLIQLLDWFGRQGLETTSLTLVGDDEYLGTLEPDRLRYLFRERRGVSE